MKKIILCLLTAWFSIAFIPIQPMAAKTTLSDSLAVIRPAVSADLPGRSNETKTLKISDKNFSKKNNNGNNVVVSERHDHKGKHGAVYFSAGGIVVLVLVAIILL